LRIARPDHRLKALRDDYARMKKELFFGEPPTFDEILAGLKNWESEFNQK